MNLITFRGIRVGIARSRDEYDNIGGPPYFYITDRTEDDVVQIHPFWIQIKFFWPHIWWR